MSMEYGCIGEKLTHSFSKELHQSLASYNYQLKELPPNALEDFIRARNFKGINVTIPYKQAVMPLLDDISDRARAIGAVNTVVNDKGRLLGDNTDFAGLQALILRAGIELRNKTVLVLGSGGTSHTALAVAQHLGAQSIHRVSRTAREGCITYAQAQAMPADVIINTTPCGMSPHIGASPLALQGFTQLSGVVDVIYNPLRSALVLQAEALGIQAVGGLYMLVAQAAAAVALFTGKTIAADNVDAAYRRLLHAKRNLVLIGMPGCGKTTLGKLLAHKLSMDFIDTDEVIIQRTGRSIPEIFAQDGEKAFRCLESQVIAELTEARHTIIATGGGAILNPQNVQALKANGRMVFIDRPLEQLAITPDRPLSCDAERLASLYRLRHSLYTAAADSTIHAVPSMENNLNALEKECCT